MKKSKLILTRKPGQSIKISDDITVIVESLSPSKVMLSISAPRDISVHRTELYNKITSQKIGN